MLIITGTIRIDPDRLDAARPVMAQMIEASRAEAGCLDYAYAQDIGDPGLIRVFERWQDQAALDRHFTTDHIAQWLSQWPELGITDRQLTVHDIGGSRPV